MSRLRLGAPVLGVMVFVCVLQQFEPSLAVWVLALTLPWVVGAALFVPRLWKEPVLALVAAFFSVMAAVNFAWVFNLEGNAIMGWAVLFGLPLALLFLAALWFSPAFRGRNVRRGVFIAGLGGAGLVYGIGAAYFCDTFFDRNPTQPFYAKVEARMVSSYFGFLFKQYELNVGPWGEHTSRDTLIVPHAVLLALRDGDTVRIERSPGLLGAPWVSVAGRARSGSKARLR